MNDRLIGNNGYMGERDIPIEATEFRDFDRDHWVMWYLQQYGGIDGAHHKDWLLDQIARILTGAEITVRMAEWLKGGRYEFELRVDVGEPTEEYHDWVKSVKAGEDGPETYGYSTGIAP